MTRLALNNPERATIDDVARRAGVSIKTVSRVTTDEPHVRAATRARVQSAIDELDYRPNPYAQSLAARRRRTPPARAAG